MSFKHHTLRGGFCAAILLSLTACAPSAYVVQTPTPSNIKYDSVPQQSATEISLADKRQDTDRIFSSGILPAELKIGENPIDAAKFIAENVQHELASRGLSTEISNNGTELPHIDLHTFKVQNYRASGFSPFITFTLLSADFKTAKGEKRIGVFIKRGKVPVWSFDEVVEPTFNQPLSLVVKEFSSKVANSLYGYRASDNVVDELVAKLAGTRNADSYMDVYALGFTNNPKAIATIAGLVNDSDEYIRLAAISSLGNLGATSHFDLLKSIYQNRDVLWQDRAMAIKAIGDLGTDEATAFLGKEKKYWEEQKSENKESMWTTQIIGLYL